MAVVTPSQAAAGYTEGGAQIERMQGFASGEVGYRVIDPTVLEDGHRYRVTFRDTRVLGRVNTSGRQITQDTIRTRDVTLVDLTDGETLFSNSDAWRPERDAPITDGFQLAFDPVFFTGRIPDSTGWRSTDIKPLTADVFSFAGNPPGTRTPADYRIEVGAPGSGRSTDLTLVIGAPRTLPAKPTNFRVFRTVVDGAGNAVEVPVAYAFYDVTGPGADPFGPGDAATNLLSTEYDIGGSGIDDTDRN